MPLDQGRGQVIGLREHASQLREFAKRGTIPYENSLQPIHAGVGVGQNRFSVHGRSAHHPGRLVAQVRVTKTPTWSRQRESAPS